MKNLASSIRKSTQNTSTTLEQLLQQATLSFSNQDSRQCRALIDKILAINPNHTAALNMLVLCNEREGISKDAINNYKKLFAHQPASSMLKLHLIDLLITAERYTEAETLCLEAHTSDSDNTEISTTLANIYSRMGLHLKQLKILIKLNRRGTLKAELQPALSTALSKIKVQELSLDLEEDMIAILDLEQLNPKQLTGLMSQYINNKYNLNNNNQNIELCDLAQDRLFVSSLKKICFASPNIESLLVTLRQSLLLEIVRSQAIHTSLFPLLEAIALNNHLNEYIHRTTAQEQEILDQLTGLLEINLPASLTASTPLDCVANILICLSMYRPLHDLSQSSLLLTAKPENWPGSLKTIAVTTLFDFYDESERAERIPSLTAVENTTSKEIQQQYEQNPYPRWLKLHLLNTTDTATYLQAKTFGYQPPAVFKKSKVQILIAGCGTGQHPLTLAAMLPGAEILAVDLSRRSLAYAQRKADEYNISNVKFYQGDILKLHEINQRFDLIESVGVLHHLKDPLAGWKSLRQLLKNDGIMKIGLYSQIARREINRQRQMISDLSIEPNAENIRRYRQALIQKEPNSKIFLWRDFWSLSECRDLLFHTQEHQYSWPIIDDCCKNLNMEFVAVNGQELIFELYQRHFPENPACNNLKNWHQLEIKHPEMFRSMYSFLCKKRPD